MDLAMPKMDGVEATRRLKTDERTRQIPIIIVSGHAMQGLAGAARAAGAEGYCMKPCPPETLEREIERVLAGRSAPRPD
jgi:CheY-like chemotaxis protein